MEVAELALLCAIVAALLARQKGRSALAWLCLGLLCGPLALVVALLPARGTSAQGRCPICAETIRAAARRCPHCRSAVAPPTTATARPPRWHW